MEKKNNIVTIILVLLVIVALIGGYFIGKSNLFEKKDNKPNDNNSLEIKENKSNENSNISQNNEIETSRKFEYYDIFENKKLYDIYDISVNEASYMIIGYKNKTYMVFANSMTGIFDCNYKLVNNEVKFSKGVYELADKYDEDDELISEGCTIREYNLDPDLLYKVVSTKYPYSTDAQFSTFFIHKDGSVDYYHFGERGEFRTNVLKDYKVKDVSEECLKNGEDGCEKAQLNLTLQDGSSAKADKFDWE